MTITKDMFSLPEIRPMTLDLVSTSGTRYRDLSVVGINPSLPDDFVDSLSCNGIFFCKLDHGSKVGSIPVDDVNLLSIG